MSDLQLAFLASLTLSKGAAVNNLGLTLNHEGPVTQLSCTGELTTATGEIFQNAVLLSLETDPKELRVDTTRLLAMSPEGVVALLRAMWRCEEAEVAFRLIAGPIVDDALNSAGVAWVFDDSAAQEEGLRRWMTAPWAG